MGQQTMPEPIHYIVSETGERTGVVLSWETYAALRGDLGRDSDLMDNLSEQELRALAEGMLTAGHQERLDGLLQRNEAGQLDEQECQELDNLLAGVDALNILKARALFTLRHRAVSAA